MTYNGAPSDSMIYLSKIIQNSLITFPFSSTKYIENLCTKRKKHNIIKIKYFFNRNKNFDVSSLFPYFLIYFPSLYIDSIKYPIAIILYIKLKEK